MFRQRKLKYVVPFSFTKLKSAIVLPLPISCIKINVKIIKKAYHNILLTQILGKPT